MIKLKGIPASNGIASGTAYIFHHTEVGVKRETISDPSSELTRLETARNTARYQLKAIKKRPKQKPVRKKPLFLKRT